MSPSEAAHYTVTAYPPGAVLRSAKCNFMAEESEDVVIAKASRLEVRTLADADHLTSDYSGDVFPVVLQLPINGRITALETVSVPGIPTSVLFLLLERLQYAAISYAPEKSSFPDVQKGSRIKIAHYPISTHGAGSLRGGGESDLSKEIDKGPLVATHSRCIVLHVFDGLLTVIPINRKYQPKTANPLKATDSILGAPFHCRVEEHTILDINFLQSKEVGDDPNVLVLAVLYQDSSGMQHLTTHVVNLLKKQLNLNGNQSVPTSVQWLKKSAVDGGSCMVVPVESIPSAALVVGQRQLSYCSPTTTKILPVTPSFFMAYTYLPPDSSGIPRVMIADEFGNLHIVSVSTVNNRVVVALQLQTLGSCTMASTLEYLGSGLVFVGSALGDSQLVQVHDAPVSVTGDNEDPLADTTYLSVLDEYNNLGPVLDFDLVPTAPTSQQQQQQQQQHQPNQSQVVTVSGCGKLGTIRVVRNGIGMNEYAAVEIPGIQAMWSLRKTFSDTMHTYLVQSFVGETRVLGVMAGGADGAAMSTDEDEDVGGGGGGLEEVVLPGLDSSCSSLYVGNIASDDLLLQITENEIRLMDWQGEILSTWSGSITVANANEAGQIAVALHGGMVLYFEVADRQIHKRNEKQMDREVSCIDIHPFAHGLSPAAGAMDTDETPSKPPISHLVAVGLWDDYTVRFLTIEQCLDEAIVIDLSTIEDEEKEELTVASPSRRNRNNAMARSLCMVTIDYASSSSPTSDSLGSRGVNMLFVGLGDGTLVSFAIAEINGSVVCQSKKEVCLGTQRIDLIPLRAEQGGSCVLATGDRPTVVYLAGAGGASADLYNPKLCYSTVNVSADEEDLEAIGRPSSTQNIAVTVAAPFMSSLLDSGSHGSQHYSLCVADEKCLRLGVIDDIQKLHVTTCRLGMSPRRIVYCAEARMFAVGCMESGLQSFAIGDERSMGNCIRFMEDTTFEDLERIDMEPFEEILSMAYVSMKAPASATPMGEGGSSERLFLLVGTAYALPDEPEPTRGRVLVYSCEPTESPGSSRHVVRQVTELTTEGGVYSICQFYGGKVLIAVNTRVSVCKLEDDCGVPTLVYEGEGHFGHILSLCVKSRAKRKVETEPLRSSAAAALDPNVGEPMAVERYSSSNGNDTESSAGDEEMIAIVGDMTRSIGLMQYYPNHQVLEEVARDFNTNWITAVEMLTDNVFLGGEQWCNLFCLRRNTAASSEEVRCRLDTIGEFHLGEMCNKFMTGSLVMPTSNSGNTGGRRNVRRRTSPTKKRNESSPCKSPVAGAASRGPQVVTGSQTIFGSVDGTLGVVMGLDSRTAAFFLCLQRVMARTIQQVGDFSHQEYRAYQGERRNHPSHGFVDGDLVEAFLDLDYGSMATIVEEMNRDGGWDYDGMEVRSSRRKDSSDEVHGEGEGKQESSNLSVEDVLAMVEEMSMLH